MKASLILACILAIAAAKTEFAAEHVEELTSKNFAEKVLTAVVSCLDSGYADCGWKALLHQVLCALGL